MATSSNSNCSSVGMKATQILKLIPEFHGKPHENVHEFLDAVDEGVNLVNKSEEKILLSFLRTKLKGTAFKAIQYVPIESWGQFKEHLQRRFGVGDTIRYIEKEFTMLVQGNKESVAEFGERTCTLAAKITEYNVREKKYNADLFQKIMEDRILVQFVTGLREPVRFQVKAYKCNDYQEALAVACNLEKETLAQKDFDGRNYLRKMGLRDQGNYNDKPKCFVCNKFGHKAKDCYNNKPKTASTKIHVIQCFNCNKPGHVAKNCRAKINKPFNFAQRDREIRQGNDNRLPLESRAGRPANEFKSAQ